MDTLIRFAHSAFFSYTAPSCKRPVFSLLRMPLSIPFLPRRRLHSASSSPSLSSSVAMEKENCFLDAEVAKERMLKWEDQRKEENAKGGEMILYSITPHALLLLAALPGTETVRSIFGPFVELVKTWNLPEWLVHWGHPGNMAGGLWILSGISNKIIKKCRRESHGKEPSSKVTDRNVLFLHSWIYWRDNLLANFG